MFALDIMSRNIDGHFQWTEQLVATLNAFGDLSIDETSTTEEILEAVKRLDVDSRRTLLSMKVSFKNDFKTMMEEEEVAIKKESQKLFYGMTALVIVFTGYIVMSGDNHGVEPETLHKFMEMITHLMKYLSGTPIDGS